MPTNTNVTNLKINTLTEAQYDTAVSGGVIGANELSILTDVDESIQVSTMPTAGADELGKVYQFIGTTDANYTHGYFYECVSDGQQPATYSWSNIQVQASSGGLPSQTGNAGKFLTTDGTDASWSDKPLVNTATGFGSLTVGGTATLGSQNVNIGNGSFADFANSVVIGYQASTNAGGSIVIGKNAGVSSSGNGIAIGYNSYVNAPNAIQLNAKNNNPATNANANTFKVANANGNFEIMSADGTIPTDRFTTTPSADGTYYPTLSISSGTATRSWGAISALQNIATQSTSIYITDRDPSTVSQATNAVVVGQVSGAGYPNAISEGSVNIGSGAYSLGANYSIAIGRNAVTRANYAIQLGGGANSDAGTLKFYNGTNNFEIMSADGTIPSDRLVHAINKYSTMPTAASTNEGWIVQFTGTTDSTYTHGHLYECVSDGADPATYSWTEVQLGGGGSSYTAGTGIDITSGVISVTTPTLTNFARTTTNKSFVVGYSSSYVYEGSNNNGYNTIINGQSQGGTYLTTLGHNSGNGNNANYVIAVGINAKVFANNGMAIGQGATVDIPATNAIQIGGVNQHNPDANTLKVANANGNYEMMSADGTIPTARLTKVNSTITLAAADWSSNTQTVNVTGMTATGVVMVSPVPANQSAYTSAGILCTAQAAGTLTFTCSSVPSGDIDVNVVML